MKVSEDFSSQERREREALEESDALTRVTLATSDGRGWNWVSLRSVLASLGRLFTGVVLASLLRETWAPMPTPTPTPSSKVMTAFGKTFPRVQ